MPSTDDTATAAAPDAPETQGRLPEIRRAAARLFRQQGYPSTSIQEVAEAVGMLKGSLYYYIDSKEQLLFDIIRDAHEHSLANIRALADSDAPAVEVLRTFIEGHVLGNVGNLAEMGVFFHDFRHLSDEHRAEIIAERDEYDQFVRGLVSRGQAEGDIDPDADTVLTAMGILGMINWIYQWYRPDGDASPEQIGHAVADLVIGGLVRR